jgi:nicotinate-nucleotide pyrophosphorylase (carboxylating)
MNWLLVDDIIRRALMEDLGHGDITTELLPGADRRIAGCLVAKMPGVICGTEVARRCFALLDPACTADMLCADGDEVGAGDVFFRIHALAGAMLAAERVALNFLQRMSGIATLTWRLAQRAMPLGIRVVETRKTTPGLRILDKYAVRTGGGFNHRFDLDSCVMLKDNHFAIGGGDPGAVVRAVKSQCSHTMRVIAEAGDPSMIEPILAGGADVVLLDNFTPELIRSAVVQIAGRAVIEISGGINEANLDDYLIEGVDVISIGALTHSYRAIDISLEV